jgi:hypothetical protein
LHHHAASPVFVRAVRTLRSLASLVLVVGTLGGCISAAGRNLRAGDTALAGGAWQAALGYYEAALKLEPDNEDAKRQIQVAKAKGLAQLVPAARARLAEGRTLDAVEMLAIARSLGVPSAALDEAAGEAVRVAVPMIAAHERQEQLESAITLAEASLRAKLPGYDAATEAARLRSKGAELALGWSDQFKNESQPALARLEIERALSFVPRLPQALARVPDADRALRSRVTYVAVVGRFDAEPEAEALAVELSLPMIAELFPPNGPVVVQAESPADRARPGLRLGGVFERYRYAESRAPVPKRCAWICGTDEVTNPEHTTATNALARAEGERAARDRALTAARDERPRAERERGRAERALTSAQRREDAARQRHATCDAKPRATCDAERSAMDAASRDRSRADAEVATASERLSKAERRLAKAERDLGAAERELATWRTRVRTVPTTILVDRSCTQTFTATIVERRLAAGMRIKAVGFLDDAPVLAEEEIDLVDVRRDETYAADPRSCPQSADPLTLPSENEQRYTLARDGAAVIAKRIESAQQRYRLSLLTQARTETQPHVAAELYLEYLASRLAHIDPQQGEVWDRIATTRGPWLSAFESFAAATGPTPAPTMQ